jgi:hypothetical protein
LADHKHARLTKCLNCGRSLAAVDSYCPQCGQQNHDLRVPFRHLIFEGLEGFLHFDSKSYRTVIALLFRPGFLTTEFRAGRRVSYVPPVRLYVFISFLFFFVLAVTPGKHSAPNVSVSTAQDALPQESIDDRFHISFFDLNSSDLVGKSDAQIDSVMAAHHIENTPIRKYVAKQLGKIGAGSRSEFTHLLLKGASYMMFVLMPLFALLIYVLNRKRAEYYLDCLIFSVHFHCFIFLIFTLYTLYARVFGFGLEFFVPLFLTWAYFLVAMNSVYPQSTFWTILKTGLIGFLHVVSILFCFVGMVLINILLF